MIKKAFKMKLLPGQKAEYAKRHQQLWPEMHEMLKNHGVQSYSIFYDNRSDELFGYLEVTDEQLWRKSSDTLINKDWWHFMKDIMETNPDDSPVTSDLEQVFDLK